MKQELKDLSEMDWQERCSKTRMQPNYVPRNKFTDSTANGLTKCVTRFLQLKGWQAERISNTGRYIDNSKIVENVMGHKMKIGSGKYINGTGTNGTADISATVMGRSIKLEVKIGKDRQSDAQKVYAENVRKAGGIYEIITDYNQFLMWYHSFTTNNIL